MKNLTQIINGVVHTSLGWVNGGSVVYADGKIVEVKNDSTVVEGAEVIDAQGGYVVPGGVELHVHGGGGHDFTEGDEEDYRKAVHAHLIHGTTSIYPTLMSTTAENICRTAEICTKLMNEPGSPILGLHLEGHYLSPKKAGAQLPDAIKNPDPEEYKPIIEKYPCIKRWDIAPELDGALELGAYLTSKGVLPSIAHTSANYQDVVKGYEVGYRHATHFYNAMAGFHNVREYKEEGTVESIYLIDGITVEVIADGIHVPIPLLKLVYKIKGVEGTALCTDGLSCSAGDENMYLDPRFVIENGVCKLADRSALAGSVATMDRLIRTMVNEVGVTLFDAVRMSSETPARIMGVFDRKGSIRAGKDADMCIYDADLNLKSVIAMGNKIV